MAVTDVADLLVTVGFLVQSVLLIWSTCALIRCVKTIRKQVEVIDVLRDLLRMQLQLQASFAAAEGWKWKDATAKVSTSPDEARIQMRVMLTELLQELHK